MEAGQPRPARVLRFCIALLDRLNDCIFWLLGLGLAVMTACTLLQVGVRFVLTHLGLLASVPWTEELARYILIWVVFLGSAVACRKAQLISLRFLIEATPRPIGAALQYLSLAICVVFYVFLVKVGLDFLGFGAVERSPVMSIPKNWVYWALPAGAALMLANTLAFLVETWIDRGDIRKVGEEPVME